jgi:aldose sugar dehydrogenase
MRGANWMHEPLPVSRPSRRPRLRILFVTVWIASLSVAFASGAIAFRQRQQLQAYLASAIGTRVVQSSSYNIAVETLPIPGKGRDGGIDALEDGLLLANRLGAMWFVTAARVLEPLRVRIPINIEEFANDPFNSTTDLREQFGVKDILVQPLGSGVRLIASFNYWYPERRCYGLRVSAMDTTPGELRSTASPHAGGWRTLFETQPCVALENVYGALVPTKDAGGRLVALSDRAVVLSVGRFGLEGVQKPDVSYGTTILIDIETGASRIYTMGHRNPQGMALSPEGVLWLTEHGPRGGDELNRLVEGRNYGWPVVSYGTQDGSLLWKADSSQTRHEGFEQPIYAWVPSVGISQLAFLKGSGFQQWAGDLLVSSLVAQTLFRIHVTDGRAVVVEPIPIGHRVRDLAVLRDGAIALKTEDDYLVFLQPVDATRMRNLTPEARGQIIAARCSGCHSLTTNGGDGIGPALWGVVGRPVGSRTGFTYSPALKAIGGSWTREQLRRFIDDPESVAPGTQMKLTAQYDAKSLDDLVAFLATLR